MNGTRRFSPAELGLVVGISVCAVAVAWLGGGVGGAAEVGALPEPTRIPLTEDVEAQAVGPDGSRLYLTTDQGVTVVDPVTRAEVGTIGLGDDNPYHVTPSPDGTRIYVTTRWRIVPVDLANNVKQSPIEVPDPHNYDPIKTAMTPDGQRLVLSHVRRSGGAAVRLIDLSNRSVSSPIALPGISQASDIAIAPDGTRVYLAGKSAESTSDPNAGQSFPLVMLDVHTQAVTRIDIADPELALPRDSAHARVEMSPDGRSLYIVTNNHVAVLDTASNQVVRKITVEPLDEDITRDIAAYSGDPVVLSPNGRYLLSVSPHGLTVGTDITGIDLSSGEIVATGHTRLDPLGAAQFAQFSPDGRHLYVSDEDEVAILDTADLTA